MTPYSLGFPTKKRIIINRGITPRRRYTYYPYFISIHFLRGLQEEFFFLSIKSFSQVVIIFFILTCDPNVQFRGDIVRRNEVLIMLRSQRVKIKR